MIFRKHFSASYETATLYNCAGLSTLEYLLPSIPNNEKEHLQFSSCSSFIMMCEFINEFQQRDGRLFKFNNDNNRHPQQ
jgi:hypothetical protein